ncbi:Uu.00g086820.m01.CDS01 [Anthostomella pinea]|uniref:Enhancer of polycomb-like protein n=1 Tax=Anthostomella pinea TaxID=933095 RepID=A0AAI8VN58_9PEZI|nr:Uu.00g086820.m01.CDS01 [Anthostomella pinea]
MTTRKVRYKKLNTKTPLPVLREDQIDPTEYESLTTESQIATGVEQAEENEYHLQAALKSVGASADNEIPVPPPQNSVEANYDELYPTPYIEPRNYIKFSDTVEETIRGSLYDMTAEDEDFLKTYNTKRSAKEKLSEDEFEHFMEVLEDTASEQAPYAAVDNTVVSYDVMYHSMVRRIGSVKLAETHAKPVYEYWKSRRQDNANMSLNPAVKFETHQEHDDMDPYVCFRRREVRQTRKTRARDVQVADKLKKLRRELEDGRQLVVFSRQREFLKRELLKADRLVFEQRAKLKEIKIRLNIKTDDDDLVNTKPQKRPRTEAQQPPRATPHGQVRQGARPDRSMEQVDLPELSHKLAEKENELRHDVEVKVQNHRRWNQNFVDLTADPLPPVQQEKELSFRPAKTTFLMTPPASSASDSMEIDDIAPSTPSAPEKSLAPFVFKGATPEDSDQEEVPSYRRRVGRSGRLWIDRRTTRTKTESSILPHELSSLQSDRWKYDQDDDDDGGPSTYKIDTNSLLQMKFRSTIPPPPALQNRRQGTDPAQLQGYPNRPALPQVQIPSVSSAAPSAPSVPPQAQPVQASSS